MGSVIHTINPRLHPGADRLDRQPCRRPHRRLRRDVPAADRGGRAALPQRQALAGDGRSRTASRRATRSPGLGNYEQFLATGDTDWSWPSFDENTAVALCYTSGTTGNPKGALYSNRSTVLHAYAAALPDAMAASARDAILPVVPMFHVNAWGIPFAAPMVGAKLVLPGPQLDGKSLYELFEAEGVTFAAGVPTVWLGLLGHLRGQQAALLEPEPDRHRRLRLPAGDDPGVQGEVRRRRDPCVGHDRDVAARHPVAAAEQAPVAAAGRSSASCWRSRATPSSAST